MAARNGEIAFVRDPSFYLRGRLFTVNPNGSGLRRVLSSWGVTDAAWSPDGKRLAIADYCELKLLARSGKLSGRVTRKNGPWCDVAPSWSSDGRRLVFVRSRYGLAYTPGGSIYVVNVNGRGLRRLTRPNEAANVFDRSPHWSPDGTKIIFSHLDTSLPDPLNGNWANNARLYVMNPDGSGLTPLPQLHAWSPKWSPDGTRIVFKRTIFHKPPPGATQTQSIVLMNADGTGERTLVQYDTRDVCDGWFGLEANAWSPDGTKLALAGGCPPGIEVLDLDGGETARVTRRTGDRAFSWRPLP